MDADQKRQLENQLMTMGLAGLKDGELIQVLADLVSNYSNSDEERHRFFEDLIGQCDADKRYEMYHAMAPKLKFTALDLSDYESRINMRAAGLVSRGKMRVEGQRPMPILIGGEKFEVVAESESDKALATLKCGCGKLEHFLSDTPVGAMILARKKGWVRDKGTNKEVCWECMATRIARAS